jgi:hypothetical protein
MFGVNAFLFVVSAWNTEEGIELAYPIFLALILATFIALMAAAFFREMRLSFQNSS